MEAIKRAVKALCVGICKKCHFVVYGQDLQLFKDAMHTHMEKSHKWAFLLDSGSVPLKDYKEIFYITRLRKPQEIEGFVRSAKRSGFWRAFRTKPENVHVQPPIFSGLRSGEIKLFLKSYGINAVEVRFCN